MRPTDPRIRLQLAVARGPLAAVVASSMVASGFVIAQAFALTGVIVAVVRQEQLFGPVVALGCVVLGKIASAIVGDVAAGRAAALVGASMRAKVASAVLDRRTGDLSQGAVTTLATRGVTAAEPYLTRYLPTLVLAAVLPALTVGVIATQDILSAAIVVATLPLVPLFGALVGLATRDRAEAQWRAMTSLAGHFVDVMKGLPTLVAFRRAEAQSGAIRATTYRYRDSTLKTLRIAFASSAVLELVATLSVALVAVVVGVRLAGGSLDLRTALVVLLLAPEAYWPLRRVGAEFHAAAEGVATFEKMAELVPTGASSQRGRVLDGSRTLIGSDLTFSYPGRSVATLEHFDVVARPQAVTAITGPSGCGKSTLLQLMAGLLVPTSGSLGVDGVSTDTVLWQRHVAWLPQRPVFLADSVAANLRLGAPGATDRELWEALERVALSERIQSLGGLDGLVGEDARNLSAGEKARLALARVVLAARPWILLDEPTAHLDPITQQVILDVIVELAASSGVVVVAHDPSVLAVADRIVEMPTRPRESQTFAVPTLAAARAVPAQDVVPAVDESPGRARFVLSTFLGILASFSGVALTATAGWLIVKASAQPATLTLLVAIVAVRAFGIGRPVFRYAERLRSHAAALTMLAERRVQVYEAVVPLTPGRLGKRRGDVLTSVVDDVDAVLDQELRVMLPLRTYAAVLLAVAAICIPLHPGAGVAIAASSLIGAALAYSIARLGAGPPERDAVQARAELSALVLDAAHLAPELTMWQAQGHVLGQAQSLSGRLGRNLRTLAAVLSAARAIVQVSSLLGVVAVAALATNALAAGTLSAPSAALLLLVPVALAELALPVVEAGGLTGRVAAAEARLAAFSAMTPAVQQAEHPIAAGLGTEIVLDQVALGWEGRPVLRDLDLVILAGAKIGVVGPSGSGKSTLAAALIRFIDPLDGTIALGGRSLNALSLDAVRRNVGYVDDDPHIFATTLVENVRLARPGATDSEVADALARARLGSWYQSLPDGLHTWLGDGHAEISGGERARVGLARSLLLDQHILVLDEPVAHLDSDTANELAQDLLDSSDGRTVVWMTHSRVGLDRMDEILDLGTCVDAGDVSELNHV